MYLLIRPTFWTWICFVGWSREHKPDSYSLEIKWKSGFRRTSKLLSWLTDIQFITVQSELNTYRVYLGFSASGVSHSGSFPVLPHYYFYQYRPISIVNLEEKESCPGTSPTTQFGSSAVPNPGFKDNYFAVNFLSWKLRYMQSYIASYVQSRKFVIQDPLLPHLHFLCNVTRHTLNIWLFSCT